MSKTTRRPALEIRDAAAYSGFSVWQLRNYAKQGRLKAIRPTGDKGRVYFDPDVIDAFIESCSE